MALTDVVTTLRAAAILTTSYVTSEATASVGNSSRVGLCVDFTLASLDKIEIVVDWSPNKTTWRTEPTLAASSGVVTVRQAVFTFDPADWGAGATGTRIVLDVADAHMRVRVKGTGTPTASSCAVSVSEANDD